MNRYVVENLFGVPGLSIAWYGIIVVCAMLAGVWLAVYRAQQRGLKNDLIYDFILFALPAAIIGARAYYVAFNWDMYAGNPAEIFAVWNGGLAIYGGVLGGLLTAILFCRWHRFPLLYFLDIAAPCLVLGQAIGRWGNFVNQEAYGNPVADASLQFFPYAVYIEEVEAWYQATFFYESVWNLCLLAVMLRVERATGKSGTLLCLYFVGYGIGRFLIEGLRTDSLYLLPGVRVSQALSGILVIVGVLLWLIYVRKKLSPAVYTGKYRMG